MEFEENITNQIAPVESSSPVLYEESQVPIELPHDEEELKKLVHIRSTELAVTDDGLVGDLVGKKKEELKNSADAHLKQEKAENKKADIQLQEANYGVYSGVANYAGIKKPLPQKMQNILFSILSVFQTIFLIVFGIPISIINMVADGVDSVVKKMSGLTRSAMWIVIVGIIVGAAVLLFYVIRFFLSRIGIII